MSLSVYLAATATGRGREFAYFVVIRFFVFIHRKAEAWVPWKILIIGYSFFPLLTMMYFLLHDRSFIRMCIWTVECTLGTFNAVVACFSFLIARVFAA
jgi:hypothetical protein